MFKTVPIEIRCIGYAWDSQSQISHGLTSMFDKPNFEMKAWLLTLFWIYDLFDSFSIQNWVTNTVFHRINTTVRGQIMSCYTCLILIKFTWTLKYLNFLPWKCHWDTFNYLPSYGGQFDFDFNLYFKLNTSSHRLLRMLETRP